MTTVAYTQFYKRLDEFFARAEDEVIVIRCADGQDRVLLSKLEYDSLLETAHLLSTVANAARLQAASAEIQAEQ